MKKSINIECKNEMKLKLYKVSESIFKFITKSPLAQFYFSLLLYTFFFQDLKWNTEKNYNNLSDIDFI